MKDPMKKIWDSIVENFEVHGYKNLGEFLNRKMGVSLEENDIDWSRNLCNTVKLIG